MSNPALYLRTSTWLCSSCLVTTHHSAPQRASWPRGQIQLNRKKSADEVQWKFGENWKNGKDTSRKRPNVLHHWQSCGCCRPRLRVGLIKGLNAHGRESAPRRGSRDPGSP